MATVTTTEVRRRPLASWWRGRYGAQMMVEIAICAGLLTIYRGIRTVTKTDLGPAFANARDVINLERMLGLLFEDNLQGWLIDHPFIIRALNHYYIWFHFPAAIAFLVWLYWRHGDSYRPIRNLMAFVTFSALVIHLIFPLAPPRMMPGFYDTMRLYGPSIYPTDALEGAANQIAAMPSLHFGWALIEALAVIYVLSTRWKWLTLLHPALMALAIIATANHWWLDAAAAGVLIFGAIAVYRVIRVWLGDRHWSWSHFRFEPGGGLPELAVYPNEHHDTLADSRAESQAESRADSRVAVRRRTDA